MIADPAEAGVPDKVRALLRATGRPGEHVFVIDASSGAVLDASTAPPAPRLRLPGAPELQRNPTDFQRGVYRHAMSRYRAIVRLDRAQLRRRQLRELAAWAATVAARVARARSLHPAEREETSLGRALNATAAQLSSLLQAGVSFGPRKVVAVLGIGAYRSGFQRRSAALGRQEEDLAGSVLWLLPNPSGLNASYPLSDLVGRFSELRRSSRV